MQKYKETLIFIWNSFSGHRKLFYVFFIGRIISGIFSVIIPVLAKLEMDQLVEKNKQLFGIIELTGFSIFIIILLIIFITTFIEDILRALISFFEEDYIKIYDNQYSIALYKRLENTDPGIFLNARNKRFIGDILGNSSKIGDWVRSLIGESISNIFFIIGIITVLSLINIWILVVLILSTYVIYLIEKLEAKYREKYEFKEKFELQYKIRVLEEQIRKNFTYLMSSGGFKIILSYFTEAQNQTAKESKKFKKKTMVLGFFSFIIENISEIFVKIIVGYSIFFSTASVGTMTLTLLYVGKIKEVFNFMRHLKFHVRDFKDDLLKLDLFLQITKQKKEKRNLLDDFHIIEFKNVSFSYPNFAKEELKYLEIIENRIKSYGNIGDYGKDELHMIEEAKKEAKQTPPMILKNINLSFETGKTYGIVGKNGAGKTTLTSLLMNYFDSYNGSIQIDNQELKNFKRDFFENNIAVITQMPYIIDGFSLRENLMLGVNKKYDDDMILELLDTFGLKKKILKNRKGLESEIGHDSDFSGGEKQIIALVRIILQDKKIIIMDEGTNQLDAENEMLVMSELLKKKKDKIVIFITHRMTTIRRADCIYCLENGEIKHIGKHKDLINKENIYSYFWKKQVEE